MITVLTGGTGGAKFIDGLRQIVAPEELTIIVNTGDDLLWWGLYVSPDIDSITYMLAGKLSQERGWGVKGDTFYCLQAMGQLGQPIWFHAGDRDIATHILRSKMLADGKTLSEVTAEIAGRFGIRTPVLPMTNSRVETRVLTPIGELSFEEYFVQRWYQDPVESVRYAGSTSPPGADPTAATRQFAGYSRHWLKAAELTAVWAGTAECALIPRRLFLNAGGFSRELIGPDLKTLDFSMRLGAQGTRCYWAPDVALYALDEAESSEPNGYWTRVRGLVDRWAFQRKWSTVLTATTVTQ